ncbi:MAG: alpha/beta hydrolase domain-containing protein [Alphaproteobacteria bacterium]
MTRMRNAAGAAAVGLLALCPPAAAPAAARMIELKVVKVESPAFGGRSFGAVGTYDRIVGRATLALDPAHKANAGIDDLDKAPRDAAGRVEALSDIEILRPTDAARGNRTLFFEVVNRGRRLGLVLFNDGPGKEDLSDPAAIGNGFLMEQGYTVVWAGWQPDEKPGESRMVLSLPTIPGVTGRAVEEFVFNNTANPAKATLTYPAAEADPAKATLTVRAQEPDARATPAGLSFVYESPTRIAITRPAGFDAGAIYELVYTAKDPTPVGVSLAVPRDVVAFLRHDGASPLAGRIDRAIGFGLSQSGRYLRDFLHQGFNQDEDGRVVFEGLMPHIAGGKKGWFNGRFAQPGRSVGQHGSHSYPGDQFPFTYPVMTDTVGGRTDGILAHCLAAGNCPKIMHTDTELEVYNSRASLVVTDTRGEAIDLPANVRAYLVANTPHFSRTGAVPGPVAACVHPSNPLHAGAPMRALLVAMQGWLDGRDPPPSRFPSRRDGTLVPPDPEKVGIPPMPGFRYTGRINTLALLDHSTWPPRTGAAYPVMVGRTDGDGHTLGGIRMPVLEAPLASHFGFNYRKAGYAEGALCDLIGTRLPLAKTKAERTASGDPRPSIEERWPTPQSYKAAVEAAAARLVGDRLLLPHDAARIVAAAALPD